MFLPFASKAIKVDSISKREFTSLGCVVAAAGLNAFMDESRDHFPTSIVNRLPPKFWNPNISWKYSPTYFGYHVDSWHIAKSAMVACLAYPIANSLADKVHFTKNNFWNKTICYAFVGSAWNLTFDAIYR